MMILGKKVWLTIGLGVLSAVSVTAATASITAYSYQRRVLPRTLVAGVAISGSEITALPTRLTSIQQNIEQQSLSFQLADKTQTARLSDLGITLDIAGTLTELTPEQDDWRWLRPSFWRKFFSRKTITFHYQADPMAVREHLETIFQVTNTAQNAELALENGQLVVHEARDGQSIGVEPVIEQISQLASGQATAATTLTTAPVTADLTTDTVTQTKTEIDATLHPLTLQNNDQKQTINVSDEYTFIDITADNDHLSWQVSRDKIKNYVSTTLAKRYNLKMLQKTTQSDTGQVTQEGRDGLALQTDILTDSLYRTITEKSDSPISVPLKTIAFTEKIVYPDYVTGLFEGIYLDINLTKQKMFIINGHDKVGEYSVSTGKWSTPTPTGVLYIFNKISEAYSRPFRLWMPFWNGLATAPDGTGYKGYGIHGLVCWDKACTNREGVNHIGEAVSHGCIRVEDAGAQYIYDSMPTGTPVNIHKS